MSLADDFEFAQQEPDFQGTYVSGKLLRYVASINPDCTREQFIDAAVLAGYNANTASCRFLESRKFDAQADAEFAQQFPHLLGVKT